MSMIRRLTVQVLGLLLAPFPFLLVLIRVITKGWSKTFNVRERPDPPATLNDPRWGTHGYLQLQGVKVHYVEKGDRSKPLMVFVHGFPEFWYSWRYQLEHFSKNYWCVAMDNRGYSESGKPRGIENYQIHLMVDDLRDLIHGLGRTSCIMVGHDWGGAIGYAFAARYPEKLSCYITCNLPHPIAVQDAQRKHWKQALMSWYMLFFQCPILPEIFLRHLDLGIFDEIAKDMNDTSGEVTEAYKYAFRDPASATGSINYYRAAIQYESFVTKLLKKINVPVLQIFGTGDKYLSMESARNTANFVPDLKEVYLDGVSHWVQQEAPGKVNDAIEKYLSDRGL